MGSGQIDPARFTNIQKSISVVERLKEMKAQRKKEKKQRKKEKKQRKKEKKKQRKATSEAILGWHPFFSATQTILSDISESIEQHLLHVAHRKTKCDLYLVRQSKISREPFFRGGCAKHIHWDSFVEWFENTEKVKYEPDICFLNHMRDRLLRIAFTNIRNVWQASHLDMKSKLCFLNDDGVVIKFRW